ncbi:MAG: hypothetical protein ACKVE4_00425 [Dissulfuribacterales bacterium]
MKEITFEKTGNFLINSGIISLEHYLRAKKPELMTLIENTYEFELTPASLTIKSDNLIKLLEETYYLMGKEIYDTSGQKARNNPDKYYFIKDPFQAIPFYKMKTYGVAALITNDPVATASPKGDKIKFDKLLKEDEEFAYKIADFLKGKNKQLKFYSWIDGSLKENTKMGNGKREENRGGESEIFLDSAYTKTSVLPAYNAAYFEKGGKTCSLTGKKFKKLVNIKNTSPFIAGIDNFESHCKPSSQISWSALYLSRFAPKIGLYRYVQGLDSLLAYFLDADNLLSLKKIIFEQNFSFFKSEQDLITKNYLSNFNVYNFYRSNTSDNTLSDTSDFTGQFETLFVIIYTLYKQFLKDNLAEKDNLSFIQQFDDELLKTRLISFNAEKYSGTMRSKSFEVFNEFKFIISMISKLEVSGVQFKHIFRDLRYLKSSLKNKENAYRCERQIRDQIFEKILHKKSILSLMQKFLYICFNALITREPLKWKNYNNLFKLIKMYEPAIKHGGGEFMTDEVQDLAIKLGSSISISIEGYENPEKNHKKAMENAKKSRKYIIGLSKSRNLIQLLKSIGRIETKFGLAVNSDLLKTIKEDNWEYIKQFAVVSALSKLNMALNPKLQNNAEKGK